MAGPPPPPPPPAPFFNDLASQSETGSKPKRANPGVLPNTSQLLGEIHKGARLKKAVTNDRSAPNAGGRVVSDSGHAEPVQNRPKAAVPEPTAPAPLAGLFAQGMPKLRSRGGIPTGRNHSASPVTPSAPPVPTNVAPAPPVPKPVIPSRQSVPAPPPSIAAPPPPPSIAAPPPPPPPSIAAPPSPPPPSMAAPPPPPMPAPPPPNPLTSVASLSPSHRNLDRRRSNSTVSGISTSSDRSSGYSTGPSGPPAPPPSAPPPPPLAPPAPPATKGALQRSVSMKVPKPPPPPPPPTSVREMRTASFTIDRKAVDAQGNESKLVIDDSRFKFRNQSQLPKPRRFTGAPKLYPSGRGSSVPLNLAIFE